MNQDNRRIPIRRALLSVTDKTQIEYLAKGLVRAGVEILSTGGTARVLKEAGIAVTDISDYTGFPEMMDGRIKTLHPLVHGGLLGRLNGDTDDSEVMHEHGIKAIDLLVVNLYPFEATTQKPDVTLEEVIENIDIGGPAMIRAGAKNSQRVTVVVNPKDYEMVLEENKTYKGISDTTRYTMAGKAFAHTARYDGLIANYLTAKSGTPEELDFPEYLSQQFIHRSELRYGENPHQKAAFYIEKNPPAGSIGAAWQVQGIALSYNNINDADAALSCLKQVGPEPACVIVKHANPCGVAVESDIELAYMKAYATDPTSAFGGVLAFNNTVTEKTAELILSKQFAEVLIAPEITDEALAVFAQKKRMRIICSGELPQTQKPWQNFKRVSGGLLVQDADIGMIDMGDVQVVTKRQPSDEELKDMAFAWKVAKWVKSNAIVYAKNGQTIGIGAGQMSRVVSARIANMKAEDADLKVAGSVMASDAFFPFRDGIDAAAQAGITAIIQPGGSKKDPETIAAANEHNIAMVFTDMRHFNH